jgi:cation:H+ antiporter
MLTWSLIFIISLAVLVKSADYFTESSEKLGLIMGISPFLIGVTIIAIGTSIPELVTALFAVAEGEPSFVAGNVIGSNIANILLVIGISAIIVKKIEVKNSLIELDLPLLSASTIILTIMVMDGEFTFGEGILSLIGFSIYGFYTYATHKKHTLENAAHKIKESLSKKPMFTWTTPVMILLGGVGVYFGAEWTIKAVIELAKMFKVDSAIIAVTAVAVGTSLPELAVSIGAARKGKFEIALGNIFGSNIFNGFVVMGIPSLITTLPVPPILISVGIPILVATIILFVFSGLEKKIYNFEGAMYLTIYVLFLGKLFNFL